MVLTSLCGLISEIEQDEITRREATLSLFYRLREIGEQRLLTRSLNWQRFLYVKPDGLNETTENPKTARETYSRQANRKRWARQKANRNGPRALLDQIR